MIMQLPVVDDQNIPNCDGVVSSTASECDNSTASFKILQGKPHSFPKEGDNPHLPFIFHCV